MKNKEQKVIKEQKDTLDKTMYPIEDLINNAKVLTGYRKEVAVGALFNCKKNEMTKQEFKSLIILFLKKGVR